VSEPDFLTLAEVINLHADQIQRYGGTLGVRDLGLLESALAQPSASFGGEWLHRDLFEMAAAYAYHLCQNHPFIDGNKRTALVCALVFLELNGISLLDPKGRLKDAMLQVADGQMNKTALATLFRTLPTESKK
jgi:death-on-curing protein